LETTLELGTTLDELLLEELITEDDSVLECMLDDGVALDEDAGRELDELTQTKGT
jgi:hypothetical protein